MSMPRTAVIATLAIVVTACSPGAGPSTEERRTPDFEAQVAEYIQKFPYQDSYNDVVRYTDGDPALFNRWEIGEEPVLVKAGEDKVVRMNNDTTAVRNDDRTVTFNFKQSCGDSGLNCLEVPAGRFDIMARYYLPREPIITGAWTLPGVTLVEGGAAR